MALILPVNGLLPIIGRNCFLAPNATIVGDVTLGEQCSVWFNTVIRGDVNSIIIGDRVNIQDGTVIHCTYKKTKTTIGNDVSIGHNAIIHGCTIEDEAMVGMGAIVMDRAIVQRHAMVAAGAVVLENQIVETGFIYAGVPAKKLKKLGADQQEFFIKRTAKNYIKYASWFDGQLHRE